MTAGLRRLNPGMLWCGPARALLLGLAILLCAWAARAAPVSATDSATHPLGLSTQYLKETDGPLTLESAVQAYARGRFSASTHAVLNFGIGADPVWVRFTVVNPQPEALHRRLSVETAWLDRVDVYVREQGRTVATFHVGDTRPFVERPIRSRYFEFDHAFSAGASDVYMRVQTPDPMVLPIYLTDAPTARVRQSLQAMSYGGVYGFLLALMAYNAMLYFSLRSRRFLLYAAYLGFFVAMNGAYTGHGFAWLWPNAVHWQQWANPVLMVVFAVSGLLFATRFLGLRQDFPRLRRMVLWSCAVVGVGLAGAIVANSQVVALRIAFSFALLFTGTMLALGVISVRAGRKFAQYFLLAAFSAMLGAGLTTLSVWGWIPYNAWTFRAVELGMLLDATLLALALAYQLRLGEQEKAAAMRLSQLDPLTGLDNRRAFYDKTAAFWAQSLRHGHATSVMLLDIDYFKKVNDAHGHAHGDAVLRALAASLRRGIRLGDVLARWGGEEFIVFLPETDLAEAKALAVRLQAALAAMRVPHDRGETVISASFGVAVRDVRHATLDALIASADVCLFHAKQQGRNRVTYDVAATSPPA